jgi:hypothetical protein
MNSHRLEVPCHGRPVRHLARGKGLQAQGQMPLGCSPLCSHYCWTLGGYLFPCSELPGTPHYSSPTTCSKIIPKGKWGPGSLCTWVSPRDITGTELESLSVAIISSSQQATLYIYSGLPSLFRLCSSELIKASRCLSAPHPCSGAEKNVISL